VFFKNKQTKTSKQHETLICLETIFVLRNISSKVDLIWQLRPIRKVEHARTLILFLSSLFQKLDFHNQNIAFYFRLLISTPVFFRKSHFSCGDLGLGS